MFDRIVHLLSAIGGVFGLWVVVRSLRETWLGAHEGIRCHLLRCDHCGKMVEWAHSDGCSRER
jgi:hypothetical protein